MAINFKATAMGSDNTRSVAALPKKENALPVAAVGPATTSVTAEPAKTPNTLAKSGATHEASAAIPAVKKPKKRATRMTPFEWYR